MRRQWPLSTLSLFFCRERNASCSQASFRGTVIIRYCNCDIAGQGGNCHRNWLSHYQLTYCFHMSNLKYIPIVTSSDASWPWRTTWSLGPWLPRRPSSASCDLRVGGSHSHHIPGKIIAGGTMKCLFLKMIKSVKWKAREVGNGGKKDSFSGRNKENVDIWISWGYLRMFVPKRVKRDQSFNAEFAL